MVRKGPSSPLSTISRTLRCIGSQRRLWSMERSTSLAVVAAIMRSASAREVAMGFSQKIARALPMAAATVISAWAWSDVATLTISGSSASSISR